MSSDSSEILDAALNLPDPERANLAYRLLQSLKPSGVLSDGDPNFDADLERRVDDYEAGRTSASDWDDVPARLRTKPTINQLMDALEQIKLGEANSVIDMEPGWPQRVLGWLERD